MRYVHWAWVLGVSAGIFAIIAAGYSLRYSLATIGIYSLSLYGVATITHFLLQMWFASRNTQKWQDNTGSGMTVIPYPLAMSVSVVIPVYKESPETFRDCLRSVANQDYPYIRQVIVSNDGEDEYIRNIFEEVAGHDSNWTYLEDGHKGKRVAIYRGFTIAAGDIVVAVDSDTILQPDSVRNLIQPFKDLSVGAVTGDVGVLNQRVNLLTRITQLRYWLAFNLERAAQSYFGVMSCVSGPFGAYRRSVLERVQDRFVNQRFLGNVCTFGDDRHLTNLVLKEGYQAVFVQDAKAKTEVPETLLKWAQQQLRWSRSFFREYILGARSFGQHRAWLAYDMTYQATFPFFLAAHVGIMIYLAITETSLFLPLWVGLVLMFGLLRSFYGLARVRRGEFLLFLGYGLLYVMILLPLKAYALATVWKTAWGTLPPGGRGVPQQPVQAKIPALLRR